MLILVFIGFFLNIIQKYSNTALTIPIGGIFEGLNQDQEIAFRVAIDMANNQQSSRNYTFVPVIFHIEPENVLDGQENVVGITWDRPFTALKITCDLLRTEVVAVISPSFDPNASVIQSVCDTKEIPFIRTTPNTEYTRDCCSISMSPNAHALSKAFAQLVEKQNWNTFTILYDTSDHFSDIAKILQTFNSTGTVIVMEQLQKNNYGDYRDILKSIRNSNQKNFVVNCEIRNLHAILEQAQQVGLMTKRYSYIITNLDMHIVDLEPYQNSEATILSFTELMQNKRKQLELSHTHLMPAWKLEISTVLMVDAIMMFTEVLRDVGQFNIKGLVCNVTDSWEHGSTILNYMKMKSISGLTGMVQFDHDGSRSDFDVDVIELRETGLNDVGFWNSKDGIQLFERGIKREVNSVWNNTVMVMIAWSEPYAWYKNESTLLEGNEQYEGFVVDVIGEIASMEGFNYTLLRNRDDKNGEFDETTRKWNGLIGDILDETGDIAIGDITITRRRQEFVDFTTPFVSAGIQILYQKPTSPTPRFFAFAGPFAPKVWLLIVISYFTVSLALYIMARFCPPEWENSNSCIQRPKYFVNQLNVKNSLWYVLGSLMQQGADVAPRGVSTRLLASFWAFFILVMVSYYKAQLTASLTVDIKELPFKNVDELVESAERLGIKYGAIQNEVVHTYFKQSPVKLHKKIGEYMDKHPENMVLDNYGGYLLLEKGNYAFFTESVFAEFITKSVCFLTTVGSPINEQHIAIAVRKGSPYRAPLSNAVLNLLEAGKIRDLQSKWWQNGEYIDGSSDCDELESNAVAPPLNYHHVAGIFWITTGGVLIACLVAFLELSYHIFKSGSRTRKAFIKELNKELKFYFSFNGFIKPVKDGKISCIAEENRL